MSEPYEYDDVQEFLNLCSPVAPQTIATIFCQSIRSYKFKNPSVKVIPKEIVKKLLDDFSRKQFSHPLFNVIQSNYDHALYVAEYYIWWESRSKKQKQKIRNQRVSEWKEGDLLRFLEKIN